MRRAPLSGRAQNVELPTIQHLGLGCVFKKRYFVMRIQRSDQGDKGGDGQAAGPQPAASKCVMLSITRSLSGNRSGAPSPSTVVTPPPNSCADTHATTK